MASTVECPGTARAVLSIVLVMGLMGSLQCGTISAASAQNAGMYSGGGPQPLSIPGLDGFTGFVAGENQLSLASHMVSEDGDKLYFEVAALALSNPGSPQSTVYTLKTPLMGVMDSASSTLQIDMSGLAASVASAGTIDKNDLYDALRPDEKTFVINLEATYQNTGENQVTFGIDSLSIVAPDGQQSAFSLRQPTQLVIDTVTYRMSFPVFQEFEDSLYGCYDSYAAGGYSEVLPVAYPVPVPVTPVVFVPVFVPIPIPVYPVAYAPFCAPQPYFIDTFTPSICVDQFAISAAAASAAACGGDAYGAANGLSPYVYGGGGAALAAASAAASAGVGGGGIATASAAAAAASAGYDVASASASAAAASGGCGGASAAAAAAAAAVSGGSDAGGAAASAAAAAAAASGGNAASVSQAIASTLSTPGAIAAADAVSSAAPGVLDAGGVAAAATSAASAASNGDPVVAVEKIAASQDLGTPAAQTALETARTARQEGADPTTISKKVGDVVKKSPPADAARLKGKGTTPPPEKAATGTAKKPARTDRITAAKDGTAHGPVAVPSGQAGSDLARGSKATQPSAVTSGQPAAASKDGRSGLKSTARPTTPATPGMAGGDAGMGSDQNGLTQGDKTAAKPSKTAAKNLPSGGESPAAVAQTNSGKPDAKPGATDRLASTVADPVLSSDAPADTATTLKKQSAGATTVPNAGPASASGKKATTSLPASNAPAALELPQPASVSKPASKTGPSPQAQKITATQAPVQQSKVQSPAVAKQQSPAVSQPVSKVASVPQVQKTSVAKAPVVSKPQAKAPVRQSKVQSPAVAKQKAPAKAAPAAKRTTSSPARKTR